MKYKVVFVSPVGDFKGGAEKSLFDLLTNPAVEPTLIVPEDGPVAAEARKRQIPVAIVDYGMVNAIRRPFRFRDGLTAMKDAVSAAWRIRQIAKNAGAHILHSNGLKAHMLSCLARLMGAGAVVCHIRDIPLTKPEFMVWNIMKTLCSRMVMVSRPCWPYEGILPHKVRVIPNGLPPAMVKTVKAADVQPPAIPLRVGFCGRIHPFKGVDSLLDWAAAARDAGVSFTLAIRGEAAPEDAGYLEGLKAQAARLNLDGIAAFEGKFNGYEAIYANIDVVVVPSVIPDPLPRSVMEGFAMGLPVIGYPAGGIPDMITPGRNGWLVKDGAEFTAALQVLTSQPERYAALCEQAAITARESFGVDRTQASLAALYGEI